MNHPIEIVQTTFRAAVPIADHVSVVFYRRLFALAPASRALFPDEMSAQRKKLMQALGFIVDHLADPEPLRAQLRNLGIRHVAYGAQPEHYALVRLALMETLGEVFGDAFDEPTRAAWTYAYDQIESVMLEGHHQAIAIRDVPVE